ncbi:MAG: hypothetical protein IJ733_20230, partial [Lachnospiraceae bacterium]|nr:hypothetical protein [Lachnospiraceae bacterium]
MNVTNHLVGDINNDVYFFSRKGSDQSIKTDIDTKIKELDDQKNTPIQTDVTDQINFAYEK